MPSGILTANSQGHVVTDRMAPAMPGPAAEEITDPAKLQLVATKEQIENKIDALKFQKELMDPADYRRQMTALLLQLAKTQEAIEK